MGEHIINGQFQSDKYPWCEPGFVPLKLTDPLARRLLKEYAYLRRAVDPEFSSDLLECISSLESGKKKKAYMVCDWHDGKAVTMENETPNVGVEYMGQCRGRILDEEGKLLGNHASSTFGFLRSDLALYVDTYEYKIIDLIGKESIPERFKLEKP